MPSDPNPFPKLTTRSVVPPLRWYHYAGAGAVAGAVLALLVRGIVA